jgi:hypothetical protein
VRAPQYLGETTPDPADPQIAVIRPAWRTMIGDLAIIYVGYLVMSALALLTYGVRGQLWTEGHLSASATILLFLYGNMVVVGGITVFVMARGRSISLQSDRIVYRHWMHAPVEVPLREMARVVRCEVRADGLRIGTPAMFVFNRDGRCVLSLHLVRWRPADLDRIWSRAQATVEGSFDDVTHIRSELL